jgi:flagellar protein FlgJ
MAIELAQVYTDFAGLDALKAKARKDRDAALDEVSRQFEALFLQMMLKGMRKTGMGGGLLDSQNGRFYREMYDQQIAVEMSKHQGIGLADVIRRQISGQAPGVRQNRDVAAYRQQPVRPPAMAAGGVEGGPAIAPRVKALDGTPQGFVETLLPAARKAAAALGIAPEALLAQAALETGWGRHVMSRADGVSSHNLFGIKADEGWSGRRVRVSTLEYRDGVPVRTRADFRAYDSWEDSFRDYVDFVRRNPRYSAAVKAVDRPEQYFERLQQAGYATDPAYAEKIKRILRDSPLGMAVRSRQGGAAG